MLKKVVHKFRNRLNLKKILQKMILLLMKLNPLPQVPVRLLICRLWLSKDKKLNDLQRLVRASREIKVQKKKYFLSLSACLNLFYLRGSLSPLSSCLFVLFLSFLLSSTFIMPFIPLLHGEVYVKF